VQDCEQPSVSCRGNPGWQKGVSGNPAGKESLARRRERIEATVEAWCAPYGGPSILQPAEMALVRRAAELSLCRPRRHEDVIRYTNAISRILAQCGLATRHERELVVEEVPPAGPTTSEWLRQKQREAGLA
jgi:hypothetical protein